MSQNKPLTARQEPQDGFEVSEFETNELDLFGLDANDFEATEIDIQESFETRYLKPPRSKAIDDNLCRYSNAAKLASEIKITKGSRHYIDLNGTFIFGDFIEALFHKKQWNAHRVVISTLSMSMNNVDSLANIISWGWVDRLDLVVSDYFYSHERNMLVPYLYEKCDIDNKFQLAAARTHKKTVCIQTKCGLNIVIHGSANLRSSGNLEQVMIEENETLLNFEIGSQDRILEQFSTIDKSLNLKKTWQAVAMAHPSAHG